METLYTAHFSKPKWSLPAARSWMNDHGYKYDSVSEYEDFYQFKNTKVPFFDAGFRDEYLDNGSINLTFSEEAKEEKPVTDILSIAFFSKKVWTPDSAAEWLMKNSYYYNSFDDSGKFIIFRNSSNANPVNRREKKINGATIIVSDGSVNDLMGSGNGEVLYTAHFSKPKWSLPAAKSWMNDHGYKYDSVLEYDDFYQFKNSKVPFFDAGFRDEYLDENSINLTFSEEPKEEKPVTDILYVAFFSKNKWTPDSAAEWLMKNSYYYNSFDDSGEFIVFRNTSNTNPVNKREVQLDGATIIVSDSSVNDLMGSGKSSTKVQSIVFPRSKYTMAKAIRWLDSHGYKYSKVDATKNTYRFRQHPPKKGAKYYTKKLPNGVSLVLGGSLSSMVGSVLDKFLPKRKDYPPAVRKWLKEHGDERIFWMYVSRKPIWSVIANILNTISVGEFNANVNKYYDKMFHLYLIFTTESGNWYIEKNEVIKIERYKLDPKNLDKMEVPYKINSLTMNQMLDRAQKIVGNDFYFYNPVNNNCQVFIRNLLQFSGLLTPALNDYIMQDAEKILRSGTFTREFAIIVPDLGTRLNHLLFGSGKFY